MHCTWDWLLHRCFPSLWPIKLPLNRQLCEVLFLPARPTFLSVLPVTTDLCVRPRTVYLTLWFSAACPCDLISGLSTTSPVCRLPRPKPGNRLWVWSCLHYPCRWYPIFACLTLSLIKAANGSPCLRPFVQVQCVYWVYVCVFAHCLL